jgi:hypothetical protein
MDILGIKESVLTSIASPIPLVGAILIWLKHAHPARRLGLVQQIKPSSECYE